MELSSVEPGRFGAIGEEAAAWLDGVAPGVCAGSLDADVETYATHGVRSVEDPVPITADTLFRVASISKLIVATALTRLGVDLDTLVRDHLPGFRVADQEAGEQATVRDLLTHRSGWAPDRAAHRPADELDAGALARAVADLATAPQIFPLRRFYGYSNAGFIVLARIVEVVAGEPYEHAARRLVFEPAGMERSTFFTDEAVTYPIALGHQGDPPRVVRPWGRSRARNGAGGLITSARDLIAFCRHLLAEPHGMWEPIADAAGPGEHVGVGWRIRDLPGGGRAVGHRRHGGRTRRRRGRRRRAGRRLHGTCPLHRPRRGPHRGRPPRPLRPRPRRDHLAPPR